MEKDKKEIGKLLQTAKKSKHPEDYLKVAIQAKDYADLAYQAFRKQTKEFMEYKNLAGNYYYKYAKASDFDYAYNMAMLVFLQADNKKKARKALKKLNKRGTKQRLDPIVLEILVDVLNGDHKKVYRKFKKHKFDIDENIEPDIKKLLKYEKDRDRKKEL